MTAEEFDTLYTPRLVWEAIAEEASPTSRKRWLIAVGVCRTVWHLLVDPRSRQAVDLVERWADGGDDWDDVIEAQRLADEAVEFTNYNRNANSAQQSATSSVRWLTAAASLTSVMDNASHGLAAEADPKYGKRHSEVERAVAGQHNKMIRCVFGNPFRPIDVHPSWRTGTVLGLAKGVYADRAFDRMPILADALEEAGCDSPDVLAHCRADMPHVRGCWVVDLVLGKS